MSFGMPYPYQQNPAMGVTQIVRRQMTDAERQLGTGYYKKGQNGLRGLAVLVLVLFFLNGYVLADLVDALTYETLSIVLTVFMLVMSLMAIGLSVNLVVIRRKLSDAMRDGTAIEVTGPAFMTGAVKNAPTWTVGPVSVMAMGEVSRMFQQGAQTSVLCLPRLKIAVAINNYGLRHGAKIMFPANLEAMAVQSFDPPPPPPDEGPFQTPGAAYQPPMPQK